MHENTLKKFRYVNSALVLLLLVSAIFLTRSIITAVFSSKARTNTAAPGDMPLSSHKSDLMSYAPILEKNPFGKPMKLTPVEVRQKKKKTYSQPSGMVLIGTVTGTDEMSYAVFEDRSSVPVRQEVFAYHDDVFEYGVLTGVNGSSATITNGTRSFTLEIPLENPSETPDTQSVSRHKPAKASFARQVGKQEYILDSSKVRKSLENPEQIMTDARLLPNFVQGKQQGFKISEVIPDGIYDSLGLQNSDILLRVNSLEISNPEVAMQAMTALKGMNKVTLDIIRNGRNMSMTYKMR